MPQEVTSQYKEIMKKYLDSQSEEDLYVGQQFSRRFIEKEIAPEDVISVHKTALFELHPDLRKQVWDSLDFLIEMMIHYGLTLREHQSLVRKQEAIQMEMNVATKVQDTLLKTVEPDVQGLDVGWISQPAKQMNGDYIYFLNQENASSVAVADVIGKGIPAALCMSMIKFGMDGLQNENSSPENVLGIINRIVEKSVDDSMFISMFYGKYNSDTSAFAYASAGHEPALHFSSATDTFTELDAKGLLLGVKRNAKYEERSILLEEGDFVVMMTDGVTESRTENGFIEMSTIQELLASKKEESAQQIADYVYSELGRMQDYRLSDDFTIVIFKKKADKV